MKLLAALLLLLCMVSCTPSNEPSPEELSNIPQSSLQEAKSDSQSSEQESAPVMTDPETVLKEYGAEMLLHGTWNDAQSIQVDYLVMWFGYRVRDTEYSANYMKEGADRACYPEDEFEKLIYDYFGLTPEHLRKGEAYNAKEKAYVLPTALYDLASTEYTITKTEYNGDEMKIYFDLKIADNDPVSRILTVDTSNGGMRFLSCE